MARFGGVGYFSIFRRRALAEGTLIWRDWLVGIGCQVPFQLPSPVMGELPRVTSDVEERPGAVRVMAEMWV